MGYLLGIDKGTSVIKAVIFDASGKAVGHSQRRVHVLQPVAGWHEEEPEETWTLCTEAIRDAINSQQVQLVLNVRAQSGDSVETGLTTSNRIELFGENLFINPSIGRNLKVDLVSEENFNDRVNAQTFPQIPVADGPVDYVIEPDMLARALPTQRERRSLPVLSISPSRLHT